MPRETNKTKEFMGVWVGHDLLVKIDDAVKAADLDRSKFLRHAVNEKLLRDRKPGAMEEQAA